MTDERTLTICIPTFNRCEMTLESFSGIYNNPKVAEILIVDDCSERDIFEELREKTQHLKNVRLLRNLENKGCYCNKMIAVSFARTEYCIILDSDNSISPEYLDRIFDYEWRPEIILTPECACPNFDFNAYVGLLITKENVSEYIDKPMFETMLNAMNYFVHRDEYLKAWDFKTDPVTSDSIYMAYRWLANGNKIQVVPGLKYFHRVWPGSHYQNNNKRTPIGFHEGILQKLRELK